MSDFAFAVDIGGSHLEYGIVGVDRVLASERLALRSSSFAAVLKELEMRLPAIANACGIAMQSLSGLALGVCALVDEAGSIAATNGKYSDGVGVNLELWCERHFGLPFRVENDARLALLGEHAAGAAKGFEDAVLVTLGTGVGGAVMLGGKLLTSRGRRAGTLAGHLGVDWRGRLCSCGNRGCAEAESSTAMLEVIAREQNGFAGSTLAKGLGTIDFLRVFAAVDAGDLVARRLLDRCIQVWSALAVSLVHAYDPQVIVFGGGVMQRHEAILPAIEAYVAAHAWLGDDRVAIVPSSLGASAALLGALPLLRGEA